MQSPSGGVSQPDRSKFASGTIINSEELNGKVRRIDIQNPKFDAQFQTGPIILDMNDPAHGPSRYSETGDVERTGAPFQVWVNNNVPQDRNWPEEGDFGHPCRSLTVAKDKVEWGGTVKLVPGVIHEGQTVTITKAMTLTSFPGGATIGP